MSPTEFGTMRKLFSPVGTPAGQMFRKRLWFTNQLEGTKRFHGEGLIPRMTCMGKLIQNDPPKIQRFKKGKTLQSSTNEPAENMVRFIGPPKTYPIAADFTKACLHFRCQTAAPAPFGEKNNAAIDRKPADFTRGFWFGIGRFFPSKMTRQVKKWCFSKWSDQWNFEGTSFQFSLASRSPLATSPKKAVRDATCRSFMDKKDSKQKYITSPFFFTTSSVL